MNLSLSSLPSAIEKMFMNDIHSKLRAHYSRLIGKKYWGISLKIFRIEFFSPESRSKSDTRFGYFIVFSTQSHYQARPLAY